MTHNSTHLTEATAKLSPLGKKLFELVEFDDDEELVAEIRKHPFGQFVIELTGTFVSLVVAGSLIAFALNLNNLGFGGVDQQSNIQAFLIVAGFLLGVLGLVMTVVSMILYRSNVIFITSEKIAQVIYKNIIDRKISQLGIGDVQDVTVHQNGIFARIFNYGTLVIETAGEQENYTFNYVPTPYENAKLIVGTHEVNLRKYGN